jgi:hypothetical protein
MKLFQFLSIYSLFYCFLKVSPDEKYYPGVNSLKKVKVSPPRQGNMYPDLTENFFNERPDTAMSEEVINLTSFARSGSRFSNRKFDFAQFFMSKHNVQAFNDFSTISERCPI